MKRPIVVFVAVVLSLLVLVPSADADSHPDRTTGTTRAKVKIINSAFRPRRITIAPGTVVKWKNRDTITHTTTSNGGLWDSGSLSPGDTFSKRFRRRGTFRYHCTIHTFMTGTIRVT